MKNISRLKLFSLVLAVLMAAGNSVNAQLAGCTDPLATNYNSAATLNDGSCVYSNASVTPVSSYVLDNILSETSGLIIWNNYLWTHNDNSDTNVYMLDTATAYIAQTWPVSGVHNTDWEDIAQDSNYFFIGDFGNNANGNRTDLKILRISKSSINAGIPVCEPVFFSYSDQTDLAPTGANNTNFDCEAFIVSGDSIYLFTKQWVSEKTSVYALPKVPGTHIAQLRSGYDVNGLITGATFLASKRLVVLCGYSKLLQPFLFLLYDFSGCDFFGGNKRKLSVSLAFHQVEGIATMNGIKYYISNEYFTQPPFITNPQKIHTLDLSPWLGVYLNYTLHLTENSKTENAIRMYPNPSTGFIIIETEQQQLPLNYTITDTSGRTVMKGKLTSETNRIQLNRLSNGNYTVSIGKQWKQSFILNRS